MDLFAWATIQKVKEYVEVENKQGAHRKYIKPAQLPVASVYWAGVIGLLF